MEAHGGVLCARGHAGHGRRGAQAYAIAAAALALTVYVEIFRNIPSVALLIFIVFALPDLNIVIDYEPSVILTLTLVCSAFTADYLRSGINTIPGSQIEAALSLGMRPLQIVSAVVLPQALRSVVQPMTSLLIALMLSTSLASQLPFPGRELTALVSKIANDSALGIAAFAVAATMYVVTGLLIAWAGAALERKCGYCDEPLSGGHSVCCARPPGPGRHQRGERDRRSRAAFAGGGHRVPLPFGRAARCPVLGILCLADDLELSCQGLLGTLASSAMAAVIALALGLVLLLGRLSRLRLMRWPSIAVIEFLRGTPTLLLIYVCFLVLPSVGIKLSTYWMLTLPIGLSTAAVVAEVYRAGVLAVPRGQTDAARSLG
jgi:His/Glu/Gln/Arg/opine family amino acid ABC transporter permease subunit